MSITESGSRKSFEVGACSLLVVQLVFWWRLWFELLCAGSEAERGVGLGLERGVGDDSVSTLRSESDSLRCVHAAATTHEASCKLSYERIKVSSFSDALRRDFAQSLCFVQVLSSGVRDAYMNVFVVVPPENLFWFLLCCFM